MRVYISNQSHYNYFFFFFSVADSLVTGQSESKYPVTEMFYIFTVMKWKGSKKSVRRKLVTFKYVCLVANSVERFVEKLVIRISPGFFKCV